MRIVAVTAAYLAVRPDRPADYYIRPLHDFLSRVCEGARDIEFCVYTTPQDASILGKVGDEHVFEVEPEELLLQVWNEPNWQAIYQGLIARNPTHHESYQARFPRLIAVYLGKIAIIQQALARGADVVFWFDAGHWISYQGKHDLENYAASLQNGVTGINLGAHLADAATKYGVVGCEATPGKKRFHMPFEWMYSYLDEIGLEQPGPLCSAVFWVFSRHKAGEFVNDFERWWKRLINDGKAGIEENALTLTVWERGWPVLPYEEWVSLLRGNPLK